MQRLTTIIALAFAVSLASTSGAMAYIGPGMGAGAVAVVLGVIGSFFLAIFALLYYPIKRLLRRNRTAPGKAGRSTE